MVDLKIFLNEIQTEIEENCTAYKLRNKVDKNCDVVILNGFPLKEDKVLKEYDRLTLIERGKIPTKDELERVMIARHTPNVHNKLKAGTVSYTHLNSFPAGVKVIVRCSLLNNSIPISFSNDFICLDIDDWDINNS